MAFAHVGLDWQKHVGVDERFLRPAEVDHLIGDPAKAKKELGWEPSVDFKGLVHMMVDADLAPHRSRPPDRLIGRMANAIWAGLGLVALLWPSRLAGPIRRRPSRFHLRSHRRCSPRCSRSGCGRACCARPLPRAGHRRACSPGTRSPPLPPRWTAGACGSSRRCRCSARPDACRIAGMCAPTGATPSRACSAIMRRGYTVLEEFPVWFYNLPPVHEGSPARKDDRPPLVTLELNATRLHRCACRRARCASTSTTMCGCGCASTTSRSTHDQAHRRCSRCRPGTHHVALDGDLQRSHWALAPALERSRSVELGDRDHHAADVHRSLAAAVGAATCRHAADRDLPAPRRSGDRRAARQARARWRLPPLCRPIAARDAVHGIAGRDPGRRARAVRRRCCGACRAGCRTASARRCCIGLPFLAIYLSLGSAADRRLHVVFERRRLVDVPALRLSHLHGGVLARRRPADVLVPAVLPLDHRRAAHGVRRFERRRIVVGRGVRRASARSSPFWSRAASRDSDGDCSPRR